MRKEQNEGLEFKSSGNELSLGVEIELQVLDATSLSLTPRAQSILDECQWEKLDHEFFQSTLEIKTGICSDIKSVENDLKETLDRVWPTVRKLNLTLGSSGTHPVADYRELLITSSPRYNQLVETNHWIIRRMAVYGMHVHIGMPSGDTCLQYGYFFMHMLPHIFALSASSPFWQGKDTGLVACRPTTYESLPTAGLPYFAKDWKGFQSLYAFLLKSKSIESMKDLWWDVRPSPGYGTLELRFCDQPATMYETAAIVTFIHLLAHWFREHGADWSMSHPPLKQWIFRENKWRTMRDGLDAEVIVTRTGTTKSLRKDTLDWIKKLEPFASALGYQSYLSTTKELAMRGNSSQRQHKIFQKTNDLQAVVEHNVREFQNGHPDWLT
ncbi:MAG: YbdK family carboxylate-amine ligase [Chryseolinea sp.]